MPGSKGAAGYPSRVTALDQGYRCHHALAPGDGDAPEAEIDARGRDPWQSEQAAFDLTDAVGAMDALRHQVEMAEPFAIAANKGFGIGHRPVRAGGLRRFGHVEGRSAGAATGGVKGGRREAGLAHGWMMRRFWA